MTITQHISIDLQQPGNMQMVHAVQGDEYTRAVEIDLYSGGVAWNPPDGCEVAIRYGKPDGKGGIYDALPDNTPAYSIAGNAVTVTLAPQMVTVPGVVEVQVSIIKDRKDRISTFAFAVDVEADPSKGELKSENYVNWKTYYIPQTTGAVAGQYLQIAKVDAEGRVIEVKPVDAPSGGHGGGDLNMNGRAIDNVGTLSLSGPDGTAANGAWFAIDDVVVSDNGVVSPVISHYSNDNDDPVIYRGIAPGVEDRDAANVGQIKTRLPAPLKAAVGQFVKIKSVDKNGAVTAVEAVGSPGDAIPSYVRSEADRLAAVAQGRKNADSVTFIACSDLHHSYEISTANQQTESLLHMGQAMGIIREQVQVDFATMLGDMVWDAGETTENALKSMRYGNSCLHNGFNGIQNFRTRGNHDCLYSNETGLSENQIFANIFSFNTGAVYDKENRISGYCYRDFEDHKLRVVCINTSESSNGAFSVSDAQIAWLQSVLDLSSKGDGWRSIVLGHHPPDWVSSGSALVQTLKSASGLIAVFHGHVHGFRVDNIPGTEITRIAIPNACFGRENEYGRNSGGENAEGTEFGEQTTYHKTAGTAQDTAFCVVTIDLAQKKIYADHYGAGYSRVIPFDDVVLNSYTVTKNLTNVAISNAAVTVTEGTSYTAVLTAAQGYELDVVTVTMGGVDITSTAYNGGVVSIRSVTGDVVIMATATEVVEPEPPAEGYTNLVRTSQNADGSIYNGTGYQTGYRLNSSGTTTAASGAINCGFIPYSGEVIRVYGSTSGTQGTTGNYVAAYDAGYNKIGVYDAAGWVSNGGAWGAINGKYMLTIDPAEITNATMQSTLQDAKYIRCSMALCTADDFVVTLDEPIE